MAKEYSNEYFLDRIQALSVVVQNIKGHKSINELFLEQENNQETKTISKNQGREK